MWSSAKLLVISLSSDHNWVDRPNHAFNHLFEIECIQLAQFIDALVTEASQSSLLSFANCLNIR